jgi:hypothetical protein
MGAGVPTPRQQRIRHRTLLRALEIIGDQRSLARTLHVPALDLSAWLRGVETPPIAVFLAAVDIVDAAGSCELGGAFHGVADHGGAGPGLGR